MENKVLYGLKIAPELREKFNKLKYRNKIDARFVSNVLRQVFENLILEASLNSKMPSKTASAIHEINNELTSQEEKAKAETSTENAMSQEEPLTEAESPSFSAEMPVAPSMPVYTQPQPSSPEVAGDEDGEEETEDEGE